MELVTDNVTEMADALNGNDKFNVKIVTPSTTAAIANNVTAGAIIVLAGYGAICLSKGLKGQLTKIRQNRKAKQANDGKSSKGN